jgi:hypothetical protein
MLTKTAEAKGIRLVYPSIIAVPRDSLTRWRDHAENLPVATKVRRLVCLLLFAVLAGCGAAYQTSTAIRANRMMDSLKTGQSMPEVRQEFGLPDIISDPNKNTEIWSYAKRPNSNNIAVAMLYAGAMSGETGQFVDLRFVDGKLVSWSEQEHTMPSKHLFQSFGIGFGSPDWHNTVHPF